LGEQVIILFYVNSKGIARGEVIKKKIRRSGMQKTAECHRSDGIRRFISGTLFIVVIKSYAAV
jgi:hypothetical protein